MVSLPSNEITISDRAMEILDQFESAIESIVTEDDTVDDELDVLRFMYATTVAAKNAKSHP